MKKIVIVNYSIGNVHSVENAVKFLGHKAIISDNKKDLENADAIILPGVGAFPKAMDNLKGKGLVDPLKSLVGDNGVPFLGICVGMQVLASCSYEGQKTEGLNLIPGEVIHLEPKGGHPVPNVGWHRLKENVPESILETYDWKRSFYFDHSYHFVPEDKNDASSVIDYGGDVVAIVSKGNVHGVQFHPEKSQMAGLKLLRAFFRKAGFYE